MLVILTCEISEWWILLQIFPPKTDPILQNTNMQLKRTEVILTGRCFNTNLVLQIHPTRPHLLVASIENFVSLGEKNQNTEN